MSQRADLGKDSRGPLQERADWGWLQGSMPAGPSDPSRAQPGWRSLGHASVGLGQSHHSVSSGTWQVGAAAPTRTPCPSSLPESGLPWTRACRERPSGSLPSMLHAIKGGREPAHGLAEEDSPLSWGETEADCLEEAAFQLGLRRLEGLRGRKGIAGGSEGGGYGALALGLCSLSMALRPPRHYFAEEETEARGPRRQGPEVWPGEVPSPRTEHSPRPWCCPRPGVLRLRGCGFTICKVMVAGGSQRSAGRRRGLSSSSRSAEPAQAPGPRGAERPPPEARGAGGRGGDAARVHTPARSPAGGAHPHLPTAQGGSWERLREPPAWGWPGTATGPGSAVPTVRGWCQCGHPALPSVPGRAGRDLPREVVQALFARVPPRERRAAGAAGGRPPGR